MKHTNLIRFFSIILTALMLASVAVTASATGDGLGANYSAEDDMTPDNLGIGFQKDDIKISNLWRFEYTDGNPLPVGTATNAIHGGHHTRVLRTEHGTYAVIITRTVDRDNEMAVSVYDSVGNLLGYEPIDLEAKYADDPEGHPYWINGINHYQIVKLTPNGVQVILEDVCPENDSSHVPEIYNGPGDHIYVIFPGEDPESYVKNWQKQNAGEIPIHEFRNAGYLILHEIDTATDTVVRTKKAVVPFNTCAFDDHGYGKPSALVDLAAGKIYCIYDGGYGGITYPAYFSWFIYDIATNEWEPVCHTLNIDHRKDYYNLYPDGKGGATFIIQRCISNDQSPAIIGLQLKPQNGFAWDSVYYYHIKDMEAVGYSHVSDYNPTPEEKAEMVDLDSQLYDYVQYPIYESVYDSTHANSASVSHYGNNGCTYRDDKGNIHVIYTVAVKNKPKSTTTYHSIIDPETDTEIFKEAFPTTVLPNNGNNLKYSAGMGFTMTQGPDGTYYLFHFTKTTPANLEIFSSPADDGINFTKIVAARDLTLPDGSTAEGGYPIIGNSRDGSVRDGVIPMIFNSSTNPAAGSSNVYYYFSVDVGRPANVRVPGDINGDGEINAKDATRLLKYLAGIDVDAVAESLDVNGDGVVNSKDVTRLLRWLAGEAVELF